MKAPLRKVGICLGLLVVAVIGSHYLKTGWYEAFVSTGMFASSSEWRWAWSAFITWAFYFALFFALGLLVAGVLKSRSSVQWAFLFGLAYSLIRWFLTQHTAVADPDIADYIRIYGEYAVPPLSAMLGAWVSSTIRKHSMAKAPRT